MDETNQKCKSRKRSRETARSATTRTRVGGVLSVSYHSCSGKDPQLSKGPPTARITVANPPYLMDSAYSLSINKMRNRRERKERDGDSRTGKSGTRHLLKNTKNKAIPCPREKLVMIAMNAALEDVYKKVFADSYQHGTDSEKEEAWHEIGGGKISDSELLDSMDGGGALQLKHEINEELQPLLPLGRVSLLSELAGRGDQLINMNLESGWLIAASLSWGLSGWGGACYRNPFSRWIRRIRWEDWTSIFISRKELVSTSVIRRTNKKRNASLVRDEAKPIHTIGEGKTPHFIAPGERKFDRGLESVVLGPTHPICSMIYGSTGATHFDQLAKILTGYEITGARSSGIFMGILFIAVGSLFKITAVPFRAASCPPRRAAFSVVLSHKISTPPACWPGESKFSSGQLSTQSSAKNTVELRNARCWCASCSQGKKEERQSSVQIGLFAAWKQITQKISGNNEKKRYLGNENYRGLYWRDPTVNSCPKEKPPGSPRTFSTSLRQRASYAYFTYLTKGNELCFVSGFMDWIQSASRHTQKEGVRLWLPGERFQRRPSRVSFFSSLD
ncbi:hypothetical protein ACH5RR_009405 [Cinchona calisaya]|uniref:NADH:quinone oxidoreductase/Mrp antiporter transmembrane domain-containing protein n=1 Tax=Cinchona calisaya TaxID=153742 RepID=A0ABD3AEY2_9GENT